MENQQQQQNSTPLCRAGCGFFGSPANEGLCSKCYKDHIKKSQDSACSSPSMPVSVSKASTPSSPVVSVLPEAPQAPQTCAQAARSSAEVTAKLESEEAVASQATPGTASIIETPAAQAAAPVKKVNRCLMCKKRVGLTGFTCRCGGLYCGEHRYDQAHNCSFDYKTMERGEIRKNNPVVVSDKIQRL